MPFPKDAQGRTAFRGSLIFFTSDKEIAGTYVSERYHLDKTGQVGEFVLSMKDPLQMSGGFGLFADAGEFYVTSYPDSWSKEQREAFADRWGEYQKVKQLEEEGEDYSDFDEDLIDLSYELPTEAAAAIAYDIGEKWDGIIVTDVEHSAHGDKNLFGTMYAVMSTMQVKEVSARTFNPDVADVFEQPRIDRGTLPPGHKLPSRLVSREAGDGVPLDEAAAMFDFESGEDFIEAVRALGKRASFNAEARRRTQRVLDEEDGTKLDEDRIEREALAALSESDAQEERLRMELKLLRARRIKSVGKAAAKAVTEEGPGTPTERKEDVKAARAEGDAAKALLAEEIEREARTERERRRIALRNARLANAPGGLDALRRREAARIGKLPNREASKKEVQSLRNAQRRATNASAVAIAKGDWMNAEVEKVREIRAHYAAQALTARLDATQRIASRLKKWAKKSWLKGTSGDKEMAAVAVALVRAAGFGPRSAKPLPLPAQSWFDEQAGVGYDLIHPPAVTRWGDMSFDASKALYDSVRSIIHAANRKAAEEGAANKERRAHLVKTVHDNVAPRKDREELGRVRAGARDFMDHAYLSHRKAENLLLELDGMQEQGPLWLAIFRPLNDAVAAETRMRQALIPKLARLGKVFKSLTKSAKTDVAGLKLSRDERVALALNWGNLGNREALLNGSRRGWTEEQVERNINALSDEDWDFVEQVWALINDFWPQIAALERRLTGVEPEKVEGEMITLDSGRVVHGAYYPILFDPKLTVQAAGDQMAELAKETFNGRTTRAATRRGHTKERKGSRGSNKRVWLSADGIFRHLDRVMHDLTHREAVRQVAADLNDGDLKTALGERYGPQVHKYLGRWLQNVAAGHTEPASLAPIVLRHFRVGLTMYAMGFSVRTALAQPLGLFNSLQALGPRDFFGGLGALVLETRGRLVGNIEGVSAKSAFMADRMKAMDRDINAAIRRLKPGFRVMDKVKDGAFWLIGLLDLVVANATWLGAYQKATREGSAEREAVEFADQMVRTSQGSGRAIDQADISAGGEAQRLFTAFYTFFSAYQNMLMDVYRKAGITRREQGAFPASVQGAVGFATLVLIPAIAGKLLLDGGPEDDDPEDWMLWALKTTAAYGMAGMVVLRDIGMYIDQGFDYTGPPSTQAIAASTRLMQQVGQWEADKALLKSGVTATSILTHLPGAQINRLIEAAALAGEGEGAEATAAALGLRHFQPR